MSKNPELEAFFKSEMEGVRRLGNDRANIKRFNETTPGTEIRRRRAVSDDKVDQDHLTDSEHIELLGPADILEFRRDGVQIGVFRKLRLGKYDIEARLDLHKMSVDDSRREVFRFIRDCMQYGLRTVIILHGKGERNPEQRALLKSYLAKWLPEMEDVLAFHSAQRQHGGTGAVYVMLRKNDRERQLNKERHGGK
ncbi:Smr protein/MutS2 [Oleiphilus messinensis]|uniref:Smr protein/MutS2 n=1 Tax=Oleiphilus messinensis TaxID=141451 RepID=A0A1Y0IB53_9GAMM|nr:DNA endonuclease SmrA [Oleiphilus messinensis]ARU57762.1 Smr protein/MutS2 [Oleiphilus messinensis]